jgi:predicted helicase
MVDWGREKYMRHFTRDNIGLVIPKINKEDNCFFIANQIIAHKLCSAYDSNSIIPLYLYPDSSESVFENNDRQPNLDIEIVNQISKGLNLTFTNEKEEKPNTFAPLDLLDYIYAVLHSPSYREKYKEFPRVPFPIDQESFWKLVKLGGELRKIHLLESPVVEKYITGYPEDGNNVVTKPNYKNGHVYINEAQYFSNVPEVAWNFYIGGYQPAQKWLKDRKERELSYEEILHYQKIIVALSETDRLMKEIDLIEI